MEWLGYVIAGLSTVVVAVIEARAGRERKRSDGERRLEAQRTEARAERRAEESMLAMSLMGATCALGVVTAKAVTHQHVNGDVEAAMLEAESARKRYAAFIEEVAARQVVKQ